MKTITPPLEQPHQLAVIARVDLAFDQHCYARLEAQRGHARLRHLLLKAGRQAVQFERAQLRRTLR